MMSRVTKAGVAAAAGTAVAAAPAAQPHSSFRSCPIAAQATSLLDGVHLVPTRVNNGSDHNDDCTDDTDTDNKNNDHVVIMPWIAFGTYKLGAASTARRTVRDAVSVGYRHIDTAYIYGNEKTEIEVGLAIQDAIRQQGIIASRQDVFITTKHWRTFHGYDATLKCLNLSLQRLQVDNIDLWLMVRNKKTKKGKSYSFFQLHSL
jgi:Aldo/keto reductase family